MSTRGQRAKLRRLELDRQMAAIGSVSFSNPKRGWLSSVREALGMTSQQLARRLGVDPSSVTRLENSEEKRTITLSSLDRAAEALGCRVVYALVPHKRLDDIVAERSQAAARHLRAPVAHSMALEDQALEQQAALDRERLLAEELVNKLDSIIWDDEI
jgi:predicted DNA-binding mobile mystery protein A